MSPREAGVGYVRQHVPGRTRRRERERKGRATTARGAIVPKIRASRGVSLQDRGSKGAVDSVSSLVAHMISTSLPTNALLKASGRFRILIIFLISLAPNRSHPVHPFLSSSSRLSSRDSRTLRHANSCSLQHKLPCDTSPRVPNPTPTHHPTRSRRPPRTIDPRQRSQARSSCAN